MSKHYNRFCQNLDNSKYVTNQATNPKTENISTPTDDIQTHDKTRRKKNKLFFFVKYLLCHCVTFNFFFLMYSSNFFIRIFATRN